MPDPAALTPEKIVAATQTWVMRAVIGLNLCPFAKAVQVKNQIRYAVSTATSVDTLAEELERELLLLNAARPEEIDTTLLIHPCVLGDFLEYNDFLDVADEVLARLELEGILQIASFHPAYQFAGTGPDDIENFTNRSPYPILHLLRESSLDAAVAAFPDAAAIYEKNILTLRALGHEGWHRLQSENVSDGSSDS